MILCFYISALGYFNEQYLQHVWICIHFYIVHNSLININVYNETTLIYLITTIE